MNKSCLKAYRSWLEDQKLDEDLKQELLTLNEAEIEDAFYRYLDFGTAGIRGLIGPGTNRMNRYTVRRTTEGLARVLLRQKDVNKKKGVVIAWDSRRKSPDFAAEAAGVLARNGIRVHLFPSLRPTPILSFAVRYLKAAAGIMITASHNPAPYNGLKIYGEDGAQMPPAKVSRIKKEIEDIENERALPVWSINRGREAGLIRLLQDDVDQAFTKNVLNLSLRGKRESNAELSVVFTPLHGTGNRPVRRILDALGFSRLHVVPEQEQPDPDFPTVSVPNPEEPESFTLALQQARKLDADLVIGTDPDTDRLGMLAKNTSGDYTWFDGNQIGALLLYYLLSELKGRGQLPPDGVMIQSLVSSGLSRAIAQSFGVNSDEMPTGFKYIAEKIEEYEVGNHHTFLFGYEESHGYLLGSFVRDKDAIQAATMCCELAAHYREKGVTLDEVLHQIHETYGWYREAIISHTFEGKSGPQRVSSIMDAFRNRPLKSIGGVAVREIKDYTMGVDGFPSINMIKYFLDDGGWIALRPSGTEPKIKFYFGVAADSDQASRSRLEKMKQEIQRAL